MLNASIVLYTTPQEQVQYVLRQLLDCEQLATIFVIDNSPKPSHITQNSRIKYIFNRKNLGYGAAHNIALRESIQQGIPYHLVLNTDLQFSPQALTTLLRFAKQHEEIGLLMPKIVSPNGELQYLCKLLPTPFDLIIRRFLPSSWCKHRRERFELRHADYNKPMNIPYLSGCCMFLNIKALEEVGLFDERFFMYPEDIDLTRRIHQQYLTLYYPEVVIVHAHKQASYHNLKMLWIHITNICKYFNKWGWLIDKERKEINQQTLDATLS